MTQPIRFMVFPDRPECLLVFVPEECRAVRLPEIPSPFTKVGVAEALGPSGVPFRVSESIPGRWTTAMTQARAADKADRGNAERERESREAALLMTSNVPQERTRAQVLARKQEVDESLRVLKCQIAEAKSALASRGVYQDPKIFRGRERRLEELKAESQTLQALLGMMQRDEAIDSAQRFRTAAYDVLTPDQIIAINRRADELEAGDDDDDQEAAGP